MKRRLLNWLLSLDAFLFCTLCLGNVYQGEFASSAAYRLEQEGRWQGKLFRPLIDTIFGENHCFYSWQEQSNRTQAPKEF